MTFAMVNLHWYLAPVVIAVSIVYSATRFETWPFIWRHALRWAAYIVTFLGGAYVFLGLIRLDMPAWVYWVLLAAFAAAVYWSGRSPAKPKPKT